MKKTWLSLLSAAVLAPCFAASAWCEPVKEKKIIYFGWTAPGDPAVIAKNVKELDQTPLDGFGLRLWNIPIVRNGQKKNFNFSRTKPSEDIALTEADLEPFFAPLKGIRFQHLKHNFVGVSTMQFPADLFHDARWQRAIANHSLLAAFARKCGFQGFCLDLESYKNTEHAFSFHPELGRSFEECAAKARQRGKEYMASLAKAYPGMTLFCFFWSSMISSEVLDAPEKLLLTPGYALIPAFINGMYDALTPDITIVDGCEALGYTSRNQADYDRLVTHWIKNGPRIIRPENKEKYFRQTQLGISFYLDAYRLNKKTKEKWLIGETMPEAPGYLMARNLRRSVAVAHEYVWLWGERGKFWSGKTAGLEKHTESYPFWDEAIPGATVAIAYAKAPHGTAEKLAAETKAPNLLKNGDFRKQNKAAAGAPQKLPDVMTSPFASWSCWQHALCKGKFAALPEGAALCGMWSGCYLQNLRVKPGETYVITAYAKHNSPRVLPGLSIGYRNAAGKWLPLIADPAARFGAPGADGWRKAVLCIDIPEGVRFISVKAGAHGSENCGAKPEDTVVFRSISLQRVKALEKEGVFCRKAK